MRRTDTDGRAQLESVAERHVPGTGKIDIQPLGQGFVNDTYRVTRDGSSYALRAAVASNHDLGLDRRWEARVLEGAVSAGLAPALVYCDPERGLLISRWVDGKSWSPPDTLLPANIDRVAELMRRIHGLRLPVPTRNMTPRQWVDYYSAAAAAAAAAAGAVAVTATTATTGAPAARSAALRSMAVDRLGALAALTHVAPVVCHSDLHTLNLLDRGGSLVLLDWEYAHAADPFWDLAGWSANNDFEAETSLELLATYLGRASTPVERLRLRLLSWLYDFVCLLWSELYLSAHGAEPAGVAVDSGPGEVCARARLLAARLHAQVV
jgi:thiamine kinase-like enzyme